MNLQQVNGKTITSATSSFILDGIDDTSVYLLTVAGAECQSQNEDMAIRVGNSGTASTTADYAETGNQAYSNSSYETNRNFGGLGYWFDCFFNGRALGTGSFNGHIYLHNWFDSGKFSQMIVSTTNMYTNLYSIGMQGGSVHRIDASYTEVHFGFAGNIVKGEFGLYKIL